MGSGTGFGAPSLFLFGPPLSLKMFFTYAGSRSGTGGEQVLLVVLALNGVFLFYYYVV